METLKNYTILYAEDESIIRMNISQQLEDYFKCVYVAKDGEEALVLYHKHQPDVIILDIEMPKYSGLEVAKKIRQKDKKVPVSILTAYTKSSLLLDAVELNLSKYLVKPLSKIKLQEALIKIAIQLKEQGTQKFSLGENYYWDKKEQNLYDNNQIITLNVREEKLLTLLVDKYQKNVSFADIMVEIWEDKYMDDISIDSVKKLVSTLRQKLPKERLKSVYGIGYILS
jgi:DNA-binding response OmpR family regulator